MTQYSTSSWFQGSLVSFTYKAGWPTASKQAPAQLNSGRAHSCGEESAKLLGPSIFMFSFKDVFLGRGVAEFNQMLLQKKNKAI